MTQSLNSAPQKQKFSVAINSKMYQNLIASTLRDPARARRFTAAITSAVAVNPALQECDAGTILAGALLGESLNLSPSPQLGQYYLVPFKQKAKYDRGGNMVRPETTTATFVLGYKGYIQLAIRSGQYKDLEAMEIKQGEYLGRDPETGKAKFQFIEDDDERETLPTIGYMAYFEYNPPKGSTTGFRKTIYWSKEKMMTHADTYSKAFSRQGYEDLQAGRVPEKDMWRYSSFWYKNFDDMARKTLIRHLISHWGIMSIDMQTALEHDDAVNVADDGQIVTETVEAARASIPADAQEVPSTEPEAPAPTAEPEPEAVDISAL
ncbi:MAG: recombinase RecT [Gemmiger formicilis]|uniref:recombinase RecT n=1 Tax=Gemmiger formicilis TaxID=745368 RepID=UPI0039A08CE9